MKIKVEGQEYEFPEIDSLTMDETILLEQEAGHNISELVPGEGMPMGAIKAFVMIAVMRARPDVSRREISESIGKIKLSDIDQLSIDDEDGQSPPATSPKSEGSTVTSGDDSNHGSEPSPAGKPLNGSGSPDSSPSDRLTLAP